MSTMPVTPTHSETVASRRLLAAGALATVSAVAANVVVYLVASTAGAMPQDVFVRPGQPITLGAAAGTTFISVIGATGVFALLNRFTHRPITIFRFVALMVLALSFVPPLTLDGASAAMIVALEIMHVVAAVICIFALTVFTRAREDLQRTA